MKSISFDGWLLEIVTPSKFRVSKFGETIEFTKTFIVEVRQVIGNENYVYLMHENGAHTKLLFECNGSLIMDLFSKKGEHLISLGNHVFGEDLPQV